MDKSELLRQSLARIQALKARVTQLEAASTEAIAIVGIGLRFPAGLDSPATYWAGLREGIDVIDAIPARRWIEGAAETAFAGLLDGIYEFEPAFFGLSEREVRAMDPQQRLLLEVGYNAITDSGSSLAELRGSSTGVFIGAAGFDWSLLAFAEDEIGPYAATGSSHAIAANRLSYLWDLRGPSVSLDAACASSLVALHLGVAALRRRECDRVLAGGVQAHLVPHTSLSLTRFGMMAADGRCKAFDARADGFVRSEGCGVVVLKRLSDVDLERERVYALIHATAINQDGRSNGLTAPNGLAQAAVIEAALATARVDPGAVGLIETHGTGTALGDPIEFRAIAGAYGSSQTPCYLGAVKTNLGHTEAAAGVAGLIKAALAIHHAEIPANLHLEQVNPDIDLAGTRFRLPRKLERWTGRARHAAVSSFGFGGTNSHAILGPAPQPPTSTGSAGPVDPFLTPISAVTREAFHARVQQLCESIDDDDVDPRALSYTLARTSHHAWRGHVTATPSSLGSALSDVYPTQAPSRAPRVVFLCSGQGGQWLDMGRTLAAWSPTFRAALAECDTAIAKVAGWNLSEALASEAELRRVDRIQPAIFAVQVALAALWRSLGVEPDVVLGSSMGEVAATAIAGLLSLEDAARVITTRSRIVAEHLDTPGAMATIALSEAEIREQLAAQPPGSDVEIAVVNSPNNVVVAGSPEPVALLVNELDGRGIFARQVQVDYASHCSHVERLAELVEDALGGQLGRPHERPEVRMISTVDLDWLEDASSASYWQANLRRPVSLWRALTEVLEPEGDLIVELSPHPVLNVALEDHLAGLAPPVHLICGMARDGGPEVFLDALGQAWARGVEIHWSKLWDGIEARVTSLPSYPWIRQNYGPSVELGDPRVASSTARPIARAAAEPPPSNTDGPSESVETLIVATLARELGASEPPPLDVPLRELGLDSLMASHLRARLGDRGFELPLLDIMQAPSIASLVAKLQPQECTQEVQSASPAPARTSPVPHFVYPQPRPQAEHILYCVPYGGGAASAFRPWAEIMPPWLELRALELPGRGTRLGEPWPTRVDALIAEFSEAMLVELDERPYSIYGHCSGSLLAYELAHALTAVGRAPAHLFVGAMGIPSRYRLESLVATVEESGEGLHDMSDELLLGFLRGIEFDGLDELERDPELRELAMTTMRADSRLMMSYSPPKRPPLTQPITAIGGGRDPSVTAYELWLWARETSARFDWRWYPEGNHYFHADHAVELAELFEQLRHSPLPPPRPRTSTELSPVDIVRSFYATFSEDPQACAEFVAPNADWRVRGPGPRELESERPWFVDPRAAPTAILYDDLSVTVEDDGVVRACSPVVLDDDLKHRHVARYTVQEGRIVSGELEFD